MTTLSAAIPSQEALSEYLNQGGYDRHLRQLRRALADQQEVALRSIARDFPKGTRVTRPEGGYFLWVELPPSVDALQLHKLALSHKISIAPGIFFPRIDASRILCESTMVTRTIRALRTQ